VNSFDEWTTLEAPSNLTEGEQMSAKPDVEQGMPLRRPSGTIEEQHRRRAEALKVAEHIPYDYDSAT
jgi:hypothetical protein